jgi:hypothetical protein
MAITGTVDIPNLTDSEMAQLFQFKVANEKQFSFNFLQLSTTGTGPHGEVLQNVSHVAVSWTTFADLETLLSFLKSLVP